MKATGMATVENQEDAKGAKPKSARKSKDTGYAALSLEGFPASAAHTLMPNSRYFLQRVCFEKPITHPDFPFRQIFVS